MADSGKEDDDTFTESVGSRTTDRFHGNMNAERRTHPDDDDGNDDIEESLVDDDEASISICIQPGWSWDIDFIGDCV